MAASPRPRRWACRGFEPYRLSFSCSLGCWPLLTALAVIHAAGEESQSRCIHGEYDEVNKTCHCFEGWGTAGITDTIDFLEGVCEQYHCVDDATCASVLKIPGATCPVPNWNCYCGWFHSLGKMGRGFETPPGKGGGECMGVMYTFSVWATENLEVLMTHIWWCGLIAAAALLPFGRKRAICDHHRPSLWNSLRRLCGNHPDCDGGCVMSQSYTVDLLKDDLAWSLYALDLTLWVYLFCIAVYCVALFIWSIVLWTMVIVILVVACLAAACCALGEGGGGGDLCCCCCDGAAASGAGTADAGGVDCCLFAYGGHMGGGNAATDYVMWNGTFPTDPMDCDCGAGRCSCCRSVCFPIAWLLYILPYMPENAWGGLLGRFCMGTHHMTPNDRLYSGGNPFIEFLRMGWRRRADLHDGYDEWRERVREFVLGGDGNPGAGVGGAALPPGNSTRAGHAAAGGALWGSPLPSTSEERRRLMPGSTEMGSRPPGSSVMDLGGRARAILLDRPFTEEDNCVSSSFEDYERNQCWICMQNDHNMWDMWTSCHHMFCSRCSTQMLSRRMPCPLCRVASTLVLRGWAKTHVTDHGGA